MSALQLLSALDEEIGGISPRMLSPSVPVSLGACAHASARGMWIPVGADMWSALSTGDNKRKGSGKEGEGAGAAMVGWVLRSAHWRCL